SLRKLKEKWENLLKQQRRKRYLPLLDDKIICSWNAMLLSGLLDTQKIIDDKRISKAIKRLSHFLQHQMYMDNELGRVFKNNCTYINGVFEDYVFTIKSFIDLFNHTQKIDHLLFAKTLSLHCFDFFYDEKQGFFKSDNQKGIGTIFEVEDNVIPSANAVMSRSLF